MKKICHITTAHPPITTRIFYKELKTLAGAGYDVTIIAPHTKKETIGGIKIVPLTRSRSRFYRIFFLTRKAYKLAIKEKAAVYHFHDPELLPWVIRLKKKTGAKIIYDVHEDYPRQILAKKWIPSILRGSMARFFNFYEKRAAKKLDFIITVGEDVQERLRTANPKIDTVKNFSLTENFNIKRKQAKKNGVFNLIYVGGLAEARGITQIVQAMEHLSDNVRLMLLGKFFSDTYEETVKSLKGFKKAKHFGKIPFERIPDYLFQAHIGIICLWPTESYYRSVEPTKLFEYMSAGLPIIASNFPSWQKIVEENKCGICVDPLKPKEIAGAVERLIRHPEEMKRMGENSRKLVMEKYNWQGEGKKLLAIYEKLTS